MVKITFSLPIVGYDHVEAGHVLNDCKCRAGLTPNRSNGGVSAILNCAHVHQSCALHYSSHATKEQRLQKQKPYGS